MTTLHLLPVEQSGLECICYHGEPQCRVDVRTTVRRLGNSADEEEGREGGREGGRVGGRERGGEGRERVRERW